MLAAPLESTGEVASGQAVELRLPETIVRDLRIPGDDVITIIGNLLDNAIEAASGAGAWAELSMFADRDGTLHVTVCDSGPGIGAQPPETVFRAGWSTKNEEPGHGYGLAAVSKLPDMSGFDVWDRLRALPGHQV